MTKKKIQINSNQPKKYVVLFKDSKKTSLKKAEKQLGVQFTSSAELNSKVRAQNIFESGNSLYLKNLGLGIVEHDDVEKIQKACMASNSSILHFEAEREFKTQIELDIIGEMRTGVHQLTQKMNELETLLQNKQEQPKTPINATWGIAATQADISNFSGAGVDICILDTGFYSAHPDFEGRNIVGRSFVDGEAWDKDGSGHGTHCTGTAAGFQSKETGMRYGVAHGANIFIAKVLSDQGSGSTTGIIDAIDHCIEKGYKIISMSLGSPVNIGESPSLIFERIGESALANNCLIIAAAGNDSSRPNLPKPVSSPANAQSIMAVAALNQSLKVAKFSNGGINPSDGGRIDVAAPGVGVHSSYSINASGNPGLYATLNGTSMATPHVAGIAALYWEAFPNATATEIWLKLEKHTKQLNNQMARDIGQGLIQAI